MNNILATIMQFFTFIGSVISSFFGYLKGMLPSSKEPGSYYDEELSSTVYLE